jgi:DNA-binding NarL/FixJ family response regulator
MSVPAPSPIRILIVDDHWVVRDGLSLLIKSEGGLEVVGTAATGEEAITAFEKTRPDIVLMDLQLPGISGVDAIRAIRRSDANARIVVLTMLSGDEDVYRAIEAGATTYLLKGAPSDDLIRTVRHVPAGERPMPGVVKASLEDRATRPALTQREIRVLELVSQGQRNKEIAASLSIREETVEVHLRNLFTKLDVHDRTAAVYVALRRGIIHIA